MVRGLKVRGYGLNNRSPAFAIIDLLPHNTNGWPTVFSCRTRRSLSIRAALWTSLQGSVRLMQEYVIYIHCACGYILSGFFFFSRVGDEEQASRRRRREGRRLCGWGCVQGEGDTRNQRRIINCYILIYQWNTSQKMRLPSCNLWTHLLSAESVHQLFWWALHWVWAAAIWQAVWGGNGWQGWGGARDIIHCCSQQAQENIQ